MRLIKKTTNILPVIVVDDLRNQTNVIHNGDDDLLAALLNQGLDQVASDTNRTLMDTQWELSGACFPASIKLPKPPFIEVVSVIYIDTDGEEQTLAPADYQILVSDIGASLMPGVGTCWPATQYGNQNAVRVTYRAGYVYEQSGVVQGTFPTWARQATLLWAAHLYEFRESLSTVKTYELPSYSAIISPHEVDLI